MVTCYSVQHDQSLFGTFNPAHPVTQPGAVIVQYLPGFHRKIKAL
jgi:hypothetical protein